MLFQSHIFTLVFLPVGLLAYYAVAPWAALRQWLLIGISLVFYGWWDARFIPLLVGQVAATWLLALLGQRIGGKVPLVVGVVLNLASIGTFKYLDFLLGSLEAASGVVLPRTHLILPIGISFFSFQLISYLVDRCRNDAPIYPFRPFALFVLLFPHLIAGPIVRHNELIPQFAENPQRAGLWARFASGLILLTVGLAKKVILADALARLVDPLFTAATERMLGFGEAWTAALGFSFQLFLDFSAYTEMAIGIALLFGLVLPENFRRPYVSTDLRDFWRRWHITLSNFIRDYLYIPLGGSRHGAVRYVLATIAAMAVCGLWHGAGWTFVAWGLWHGIGLVVCRTWQRHAVPIPAILGWAVTMLFVLVGWVLFRAADFKVALSILASLSGASGLGGGSLQSAPLLAAAALVSALLPSAHEIKDQFLRPYPIVAAAAAALAVYCMFAVGKDDLVNFIYFQF
jgi:D-alanyl-lipoteichoic acid acyltransferase DltB (MBOAT superfamily)